MKNRHVFYIIIAILAIAVIGCKEKIQDTSNALDSSTTMMPSVSPSATVSPEITALPIDLLREKMQKEYGYYPIDASIFNVKIGMTSEEVIELLGEPESINTGARASYFSYPFCGVTLYNDSDKSNSSKVFDIYSWRATWSDNSDLKLFKEDETGPLGIKFNDTAEDVYDKLGINDSLVLENKIIYYNGNIVGYTAVNDAGLVERIYILINENYDTLRILFDDEGLVSYNLYDLGTGSLFNGNLEDYNVYYPKNPVIAGISLSSTLKDIKKLYGTPIESEDADGGDLFYIMTFCTFDFGKVTVYKDSGKVIYLLLTNAGYPGPCGIEIGDSIDTVFKKMGYTKELGLIPEATDLSKNGTKEKYYNTSDGIRSKYFTYDNDYVLTKLEFEWDDQRYGYIDLSFVFEDGYLKSIECTFPQN